MAIIGRALSLPARAHVITSFGRARRGKWGINRYEPLFPRPRALYFFRETVARADARRVKRRLACVLRKLFDKS